jgi:hypothetical protein
MNIKYVLRYFLLSISFLCLLVATGLFFSHKDDLRRLREIVHAEITPKGESPDFVAINNWIYSNKGFVKNQGFFWFKVLGPTPLDVLENGGDCSDKSRLLMAMLTSVGIDSSLVMLFNHTNTMSTHTVLEVREKNFSSIADPVFNIVFPKQESGFYGLSAMRDNPGILKYTVRQLLEKRGALDKISKYDLTNETYEFASTVNWNKNSALRAIAETLSKMGIEAKNLRRPHFLDDPKFFLVLVFFWMGIVSLVAGVLFNRNTKKVTL